MLREARDKVQASPAYVAATPLAVKLVQDIDDVLQSMRDKNAYARYGTHAGGSYLSSYSNQRAVTHSSGTRSCFTTSAHSHYTTLFTTS